MVLLAGGIEVTFCLRKKAVRAGARDGVRPYVIVSAVWGREALLPAACVTSLTTDQPADWDDWEEAVWLTLVALTLSGQQQ